jgi:heptaprenylglyceryl phosphate synthase
MFMYIIEKTSKVSSRFHSGGGIAIVADSPSAALELANNTPDVVITATDIEKSSSYELVGLPEAKVFVFPNSGCC